MTSEAAEPSRAGDRDRVAFARWRTLARFESLLPALLFILVYSAIVPWWRVYQTGFDEGLNLMKRALVADGFSLYSEIWSDQPPLLTFILAATQQAFPFDVGAARAVVLAFSGLLLWSLFSSIRRLEGRACAWLAVIALMVIGSFQWLSTSVMIGLPAVALAVAALAQALAGASDDKNWHFWLAGALFALALQIKLFVAVLIPPFLLAIFLSGDGDRLVSWRIRAPKLAYTIVSGVIVFLAVAIVAGEHLISQLIVPHVRASLISPKGGFLELFDQFVKRVPAFVLLLFVLGLIVAFRGMKPARLIPLLWLICGILAMSFHRPLFPHHLLLIYPPVVWIAALATDLMRREPQRRIVIGSCILLLAGTGLWTAVDRWSKPPGTAARAAKLLRASSAESWVVTDNLMDAYRAGRLVPPELAVWSVKRWNVQLLEPDALIAAVKKCQPEQLLLRRFEHPQAFIDSLAPSYVERETDLRALGRPGTARHFVRTGNRASAGSSAAQALLDATNALTALSHEGGFASHYDLRTAKSWGRGRNSEPMDRGTIVARPPGSTQEIGQCFLRGSKVTGAPPFWDAAQQAVRALACAQRALGGWASVALLSAPCSARSALKVNQTATLDEGATPLAIAFLMDLAAVYATKPKPPPAWVDQSIRNGLDFLLLAQKGLAAALSEDGRRLCQPCHPE